VIAAVGIKGLLEVIVVSAVAGVLVTMAFSLAILARVRAGEARRAGDSGRRTAWSALTALALLGFMAGVLAGLWIVAA
jgi:hypothetical protein